MKGYYIGDNERIDDVYLTEASQLKARSVELASNITQKKSKECYESYYIDTSFANTVQRDSSISINSLSRKASLIEKSAGSCEHHLQFTSHRSKKEKKSKRNTVYDENGYCLAESNSSIRSSISDKTNCENKTRNSRCSPCRSCSMNQKLFLCCIGALLVLIGVALGVRFLLSNRKNYDGPMILQTSTEGTAKTTDKGNLFLGTNKTCLKCMLPSPVNNVTKFGKSFL